MEELIVTVEKKYCQHCSPLTEILLQEGSPRSRTRGKLKRTPSLPRTPICTFLFSWDSSCPLPADGVWVVDYKGIIIHSPFDTTDVSFSIYKEDRYYIVYTKCCPFTWFHKMPCIPGFYSCKTFPSGKTRHNSCSLRSYRVVFFPKTLLLVQLQKCGVVGQKGKWKRAAADTWKLTGAHCLPETGIKKSNAKM